MGRLYSPQRGRLVSAHFCRELRNSYSLMTSHCSVGRALGLVAILRGKIGDLVGIGVRRPTCCPEEYYIFTSTPTTT